MSVLWVPFTLRLCLRKPASATEWRTQPNLEHLMKTSSITSGQINLTKRLHHHRTQMVDPILYSEPTLPPKNCQWPWRSAPLSNTWFLGPTQAHNQNGILIRSAFLQDSRLWQTDRPSDRPCYSFCNNRPQWHLYWTVGWLEFSVLFSTNMAISETYLYWTTSTANTVNNMATETDGMLTGAATSDIHWCSQMPLIVFWVIAFNCWQPRLPVIATDNVQQPIDNCQTNADTTCCHRRHNCPRVQVWIIPEMPRNLALVAEETHYNYSIFISMLWRWCR